MPDFLNEQVLWRKGFKCVAGVDEVGRGAWAGPVVASAAVFTPQTYNKLSIPDGVKVDDSKKLKPGERRRAEEWIKKNALGWGIGEASVSLINRVGMAKATRIAFRKAIYNCGKRLKKTRIDFLLVDAFYIPFVKGLRKGNQKPIIDGDQKSLSIAAASILAKVYRDRLMYKISKRYKEYGWGRNKGYGTKEHQKAILRYGLTRWHRRVFVETWRKRKADSKNKNLTKAG